MVWSYCPTARCLYHGCRLDRVISAGFSISQERYLCWRRATAVTASRPLKESQTYSSQRAGEVTAELPPTKVTVHIKIGCILRGRTAALGATRSAYPFHQTRAKLGRHRKSSMT